MTKQILLPAGTLRELRDTFKVHPVVLNRALKFERNSKRDNMLRAAALQRGGLIYTGMNAPQGFCPSVETRHDHINGLILQNFGERIELQISRRTNAAEVIIDGQTVATFNDMTISSWGNVLYSLQQIYNQLNA